MGHKYDVGVPSTVAGVVPDKAWWATKRGNEPWPPGMTLNTSIGQGDVLASPLQLAVVTARLANGGKAIMPRLVHEGPEMAPDPPPPAQLPFPKDHLDRVLDAMIAISNEPGGTALGSGDLKLVHDGKGKTYDAAHAPPGLERVRMGGKTGTAQVRVITMAERATGVRSNAALPWHLRDNALFICYAPIHAPRYACAVVVEHGGGGSAVAAPIARDIMRGTLIRDPSNQPAMRLARTTSYPLPQGSAPK
jgi:penicillin-binding protein 2